jgi:hypothetical protein
LPSGPGSPLVRFPNGQYPGEDRTPGVWPPGLSERLGLSSHWP